MSASCARACVALAIGCAPASAPANAAIAVSLPSVGGSLREDGAIVVGASIEIESPILEPTSWFELVRDGRSVDRSPRAEEFAGCYSTQWPHTSSENCAGKPGYERRMISADLVAPAKGRYTLVVHVGDAPVARWPVIAATVPCARNTRQTVVRLDRGVYIQTRDSPRTLRVDRWTAMDTDAAWIATWQSGGVRIATSGRESNVSAVFAEARSPCAFAFDNEGYGMPDGIGHGEPVDVQIDREGSPTIFAHLEIGPGGNYGTRASRGGVHLVASRTAPQSAEMRAALARVPMGSTHVDACAERLPYSPEEVRAVMRSENAFLLRSSLCAAMPFSVTATKLAREVRAHGGPWTDEERPP